MRRKFLSVVLCVCMMLTMAPFAFAEGTESSSGSGGGSGSPTFNGLITTADALQEAINTATDNTTITVSGTIEISAPIDIDDTITITGTNNAEIKASNEFSGGYLIGLKTTDKTLTLGNIKLNANAKARVVYCNAGKVVINGATITGGKTASSYIGGVYMTSNSEFEMNSGSITGNSVSDSYASDGYLQYSADLWIGANANGVLPKINGGTIGNVFVNANEYSATNPGGFTMSNGTITNLYVEYDRAKNYGASFTYNGGTITNLYIGTKEGTDTKVKIDNPIAGMTYKGGQTSDDALAPVAQIGTTTYGTLEAAITAASNGDTIALLKDTNVPASISIDKKITIDLRGNNVSLPEDSRSDLFILNSGADLTIKSSGNANGTVSVPTTNVGSVVNLQSNSTFTLESGKLVGDYTVFAGKVTGTKIIVNGGSIEGKYGITAYGTGTLNDVAITVNDGEIKSTQSQSAITTNGSDGMGGVNLTINGGRIISENNLAVYLPGINGKTTVTNGTITGNTAIELRAGDLIVSGGSITGTGHPVSVNPNGSGSTTDGVGISVAQHTTKRNTNLTISGGTISGFSAIYESNPQSNSAEDLTRVTLNITGGNFAAINGGTLSVYSEDKTGFITGGYFTTDPTAYLAQDKGLVDSDLAGYYKVGDSTVNVDTKVKTGDPSVSVPDNSGLNKVDIENAAKSQATQASLAKAASSLTSDQSIVGTEDDAKTALGNKVQGEQSITVVVQPYLKVDVTEVNTTDKTMSVNISALYDVIATTNPDNIILTGTGVNAANLKTAQHMSVSKPVTIKLPLPSNFDTAGDKLSIKHTKENGSVEYYTGTVTTDENTNKFVTFTTNGFSPFVIYAASANVASIGDGENEQVFASFQAAVDAVENGGTIKVLKDIDSTVSGNKTFTVNANDKTVTLTAASGYTLTKDAAGKYTVSPQSSGGPGSSGGSISTPTTYAVNVNAATNGAVAADKKTASKGTTVTVTASPSKGYVVDAVKVVDKDGKDVAVTGKDGKYVFTMPASAVTVTGSFKAETPAPVALPFSDVKSGNWFYDAVKYAYAQGLMTGTSATTFAPNGTMNRAMIVTVLYRLEKSPAVTGASKFTDVPAGQWYSDAVAWAAANKIVNGYDETTFGPMNAVTREQMAAILFRYEQVKGLENVTLEENLNRFPDQNKISAYAIPALQWAVGQKIINGNADGTLDPTGTATRAQVAQIFTNLLNQ